MDVMNNGFGLLADPDERIVAIGGSAAIPLILMLGDSQIPGADSAITNADPAFNATAVQATTFVYMDKKADLALDNPPSYIEVTGGVQPYPVAGPDSRMSVEISLGQTFTREHVQAVIASIGIFALPCSKMIPSPSPPYPTSGPSWYASVVTFARGLEAARGARTAVILLSAGNNDGLNSTDSTNLPTNLATLWAALAVDFPGVKIFQFKINADTVNFAGFIAGTITNQATAFAAHPEIGQVWTDDRALLDHAHLTADSALEVGSRFAWQALDALGHTRPRPSTFPALMGWGAHLGGIGAVAPASWGGDQDKDLNILIAVQMRSPGGGSMVAIPTPSDWTAQGSQIVSVASDLKVELAVFTRAVTTAMLAANHGNTPPTTVTQTNSFNYAKIITIRSPNPSSTPSIDGVQLTAGNGSGVGPFTWTGLSTSGVNRLIVVITVGYVGAAATPCPVTLSAPGLGSMTVATTGTREDGPTDVFNVLDVQVFNLAAAGPTGNVAATLALSSSFSPAGAVIAIAP